MPGCDWKLLKEWKLLDLYTSSLSELKRHQSHRVSWPKLIQTVQFGIISNALGSRGKRLLASRAAFYFMQLWMERPHGDGPDKHTFEWLLRVIGSAGGTDYVHKERKHSLHLLTSANLLVKAGKFAPKSKEGKKKQADICN